VYVRGLVHSVTQRHVDAFEGRAATVDPETGERKSRIEPRPAYDVADVVVLTAEGGFAEVGFNLFDHGGEIPTERTEVEIPCRMFAGWRSSGRGKSYQVVNLIAVPAAARKGSPALVGAGKSNP
jgi:hypothetical protein